MARFLSVFFLCLVLHGWSSEKKVALNMIVKNESQTIHRCLESVKKWIDYWVIIDTGSTDGTQKIICDVLRDIPGELFERPWVNFEVNRNEALAAVLGKADYFLLLDADETLEPGCLIEKQLLNRDCYFITVREPGADYQRIFLIDGSLPWKWEGVLHESLICSQARTFGLLEGGELLSTTAEGSRSQDAQKYSKDARILEEALGVDPSNSRYAFYLAQSYLNAGEKEAALEWYLKRSSMGGWEQEIFWSLYQAALLQEILGKEGECIIHAYEKAYQYRPSRAEPLYRLAHYYLTQEHPLLGYLLAKYGMSIPPPKDHMFVESWIYKYGFGLVLANCAFELGNYKEAADICLLLLTQRDLPHEIHDRIVGNLSLLNRIE